MAKSSKKSKEATAQEGRARTPGTESSNGSGTAEIAKPPVAKKAAVKSTGRAKSSGKGRGATPRKAGTARKPHAKTAQQSTAAGDGVVTDEEIRLRAYLISEWRVRNDIPGDSAHDWLEARRQLQAEVAKHS